MANKERTRNREYSPPSTEGLTVQDLDKDDAKMLYQAYRLELLPKKWNPAPGMNPADILLSIDNFIQENYHFAYSIRDSEKTLLVAFALNVGDMLFINDVVWGAKTLFHSRIKSAYKLLNELRKTSVVILTSEFIDKPFHDRLCDYKVLRRVGTIYDLHDQDNRTSFYQTRKSRWLVM